MTRTRPPPEPAVRLCVGCGAALTARHQRRYCSLPCMGRARRAVQIRCATCGAEIAKTRAAPGRMRRYCSRACYAIARLAPPTTITCERCKRKVTRDRQGGYDLRRRQRYCSLECANADHGSYDRERWEGDSRRRLYASTRVRSTEGNSSRA